MAEASQRSVGGGKTVVQVIVNGLMRATDYEDKSVNKISMIIRHHIRKRISDSALKTERKFKCKRE